MSRGWDKFALMAYESRNAPKHRQGEPLVGCEDESELHEQIRQECLKRGWMAFHGSMAHRTFRTPGEPDYVILCDEGRILMIECKTKKSKLSTDQIWVQAWAKRCGHTIHVVRSMKEFHQIANQTTTKQNEESNVQPCDP